MDSLEKTIREANYEKYKALGNYVFEDTANLYQYKPKKFSLATLGMKIK